MVVINIEKEALVFYQKRNLIDLLLLSSMNDHKCYIGKYFVDSLLLQIHFLLLKKINISH